MRQLHRTAIVPYTPAQMFALVADIESYKDFVPWVVQAQVLERSPSEVVARLEMERSGVREKFTTRNLLDPPHRMDLKLIDGPFKVLEGRWSFEPLGDRGSRIGLSMQFEFANPVMSLLLSKSFEKSCAQLVDAFVARAKAMYAAK